MTRILYQFPLSHFAEKGRWLLDAKGLDYQLRNLYPGLHRFYLWPHTRVSTIPALNDNGQWVGDSTAIALHLDNHYPDRPPLLDTNPHRRGAQLAINILAERIGEKVRQLVMSHLIDTPIPVAMYFQDAPVSALKRRMAEATFRAAVKYLYKAHPRHIPATRQALAVLLDQADALAQSRSSDFMVGDTLSLADIALCSMLGPILLPPGTPWSVPDSLDAPAARDSAAHISPDLLAVQQALRERPTGQYALHIYTRHRQATGNWRGHWQAQRNSRLPA
ncbi:glutathione S-transferase family protein [Isoalcanivorax indicus]|uniref:glutathione S-transferase family protein n=1 Tax=Isoalcanivorax indicus TaxID=2202653 RepID=UPI000DB994C8|nr:glutathione S-transferase [Isoalcanivorax indicus]